MYKIKFEIVPGLTSYLIHNNQDTFTLEVAQQLLAECADHPYTHTLEEV